MNCGQLPISNKIQNLGKKKPLPVCLIGSGFDFKGELFQCQRRSAKAASPNMIPRPARISLRLVDTKAGCSVSGAAWAADGVGVWAGSWAICWPSASSRKPKMIGVLSTSAVKPWISACGAGVACGTGKYGSNPGPPPPFPKMPLPPAPVDRSSRAAHPPVYGWPLHQPERRSGRSRPGYRTATRFRSPAMSSGIR